VKILLGIPHGGTVKGKLLTTAVSAVFNAGCAVVLMDRASALGPDNRWHIARAAVENDCTHLWLVDNDMTFPPDTLARLLAHDKDIVGAAYNYRAHPARTVVKMQDADGRIVVPAQLPSTLFPCYAIGSGCKLVKVSALTRIPQPWFALDWNPDGSLKVTDDVWFCQQARKAGIATWCDPTLDVKHIGDFEY
jgi:hypothetical protein